MDEISGPRAIENAAVTWVIDLEHAAGREARDTRGTGAAGDVASPERVIEIKAYGRTARGQDLWLEPRQAHAAESDPTFWLYVVENVAQGDPTQFRLAMLGGSRLATLMWRKKERHYFLVPWPVADYEADPPVTVDLAEVNDVGRSPHGQAPTE